MRGAPPPIAFLVSGIVIGLGSVAAHATATVELQPGLSGFTGFDHEQLNQGGWGNIGGFSQHGYQADHEIFMVNGIGSFESRALLRFRDLASFQPAGHILIDARLRLNVRLAQNTSGSSPDIHIYRAEVDWNDVGEDGTGTYWNNWGNGGESTGYLGLKIGRVQVRKTPGWQDVGLDTETVRGWIDNPSTNYGMLMRFEKPPSGNDLHWYAYDDDTSSRGQSTTLMPKLVLTFAPVAAPPAPTPPELRDFPKLINFRLHEAWVVGQNLARLTELPFDGAVYLGDPTSHDTKFWITNTAFGPDRIQFSDYGLMLSSLQAIAQHPPGYAENFLRINTCVPGTLEPTVGRYHWDNRKSHLDPIRFWWTDGFNFVLDDVRIVAQLARDAGAKGILLDMEAYGGNLWDWSKQQDAVEQGKSLAQTQQRIRERAEALMGVFNEVYPDMTLFVIQFLYTGGSEANLRNPFIDGLFAAANPLMHIVNGNEQYNLTTLNQFLQAYNSDYVVAPTLSAVPNDYFEHMSVGFGIWLERSGWGTNPESVYPSADWRHVLINSLSVADRYVWVFTGGSAPPFADFWTGANLPQAYIDAGFDALALTRRRLPIISLETANDFTIQFSTSTNREHEIWYSNTDPTGPWQKADHAEIIGDGNVYTWTDDGSETSPDPMDPSLHARIYRVEVGPAGMATIPFTGTTATVQNGLNGYMQQVNTHLNWGGWGYDNNGTPGTCADDVVTYAGYDSPGNGTWTVGIDDIDMDSSSFSNPEVFCMNEQRFHSRTLIRFDGIEALVPAGAGVVSAQLVLNVVFQRNEGGGCDMPIYEVLLPWDSNNAYWTNFGDGGRDPGHLGVFMGSIPWVPQTVANLVAGTTVAPSSNATGSHDFTWELSPAVVQGWIDNPSENHGMLIAPPIGCHSSAWTAGGEAGPVANGIPPKLIIELAP